MQFFFLKLKRKILLSESKATKLTSHSHKSFHISQYYRPDDTVHWSGSISNLMTSDGATLCHMSGL